MHKYSKSLFLFTIFLPLFATGQLQRIDNFIVKEGLTANGKIAIIAVDSLERANENINGTFRFTINGFEQTLSFHNGVGIPPSPIDGSTFVYFKHKNQDKTHGKLYFLYKSDNKINPIKINGLLLLVIPTILLLIAYAFKKMTSTIIVLLLIYSYFSFSKGLSVTKILESAYQTIMGFL